MSATTHRLLAALIGGVWVFHGLWSKVLGQIPRHQMIVGKILGNAWAAPTTLAIGLCEIAMGIWVFTGLFRRTCATIQTIALVAMNTLEILIARDLLISAPGMVALNLAFLAFVWSWALAVPAKS
jgi:hypothetical protein